jgi:phytoene synthase
MIKFDLPTNQRESSGMNPQEYCENKAAHSGSSFYYSFLSLPDNKRNAIIALYAFCREVDDIVDQSAEPEVKAAKLDWWRDEIERLFDNSPQHPISKALQPFITEFQLPENCFQEILNGMAMDLQNVRFATFTELKQYCYRVAGVVGILSAHIFGYQNQKTLTYASDLGIAFQLTNIIRDIFEDMLRDRLYLPMDEMQQFGVSEQDLRARKHSEEFNRLMQYQAERAKKYYRRAFAELPQEDRFQQRAGIIMAAIYESLLDEITLDGFRVLEHRIELTALRKLWIVWKTKRMENKKHRQWRRQNRRG